MENINKLRPWQITGLTDSRGDFDFILNFEDSKLELEYFCIQFSVTKILNYWSQ